MSLEDVLADISKLLDKRDTFALAEYDSWWWDVAMERGGRWCEISYNDWLKKHAPKAIREENMRIATEVALLEEILMR